MAIPSRTYGAMQMRLRESLITRTLVMPIQEFIHIQGISSVVLLGAAIIALVWANSPWHDPITMSGKWSCSSGGCNCRSMHG